MSKQFLTVRDIMADLGVRDPDTVYKLIKSGRLKADLKLKARKLGYRVDPTDYEDFKARSGITAIDDNPDDPATNDVGA